MCVMCCNSGHFQNCYKPYTRSRVHIILCCWITVFNHLGNFQNNYVLRCGCVSRLPDKKNCVIFILDSNLLICRMPGFLIMLTLSTTCM